MGKIINAWGILISTGRKCWWREVYEDVDGVDNKNDLFNDVILWKCWWSSSFDDNNVESEESNRSIETKLQVVIWGWGLSENQSQRKYALSYAIFKGLNLKINLVSIMNTRYKEC